MPISALSVRMGIMDRKAVFVRTSAGDAESSGKTANLYSAIKRVLVMVDGSSTFGEVSKRVAPSLRDSLDEMFRELEKGGYIQEKEQKVKAGSVPKMATPLKMAVPPKMAVPKMSAPPKAIELPTVSAPARMEAPQKPSPSVNKPESDGGGDLDFMDEFFASTPAQLAAGAAEEAKLKAQQEAEAILRKAEQDAARIREEAERAKQLAAAEILVREEQARRAKQEAEAARVKAEQEAEQAHARLEAARLKAEQEARAHLEEAARMQQQAEAERIKATALAQAAARAREEAEKLAQQQAADRQAAQAAPSEAKLDPFFVFEPFNIQTPSQPSAAPPKSRAHSRSSQRSSWIPLLSIRPRSHLCRLPHSPRSARPILPKPAPPKPSKAMKTANRQSNPCRRSPNR